MALQYNVQVLLLLLSIVFIISECCEPKKPPPPPTTTTKTTTSYPRCGEKLDFEVTGHIWKGTEVEENAYPWLAYIYNFDREELGMNLNELTDLPDACKLTTTTTKAPGGKNCGGSLISPRYILT